MGEIAPRPASATGRLQGNNCCLAGQSTLSAAILVTSLALLRCSGIRGQGVASDRGNLRGNSCMLLDSHAGQAGR